MQAPCDRGNWRVDPGSSQQGHRLDVSRVSNKWTLAASVLVRRAGSRTAGKYCGPADRTAQHILRTSAAAVLGDREATTAYPALLPPAPEPEPAEPGEEAPEPAPAEPENPPRVLDLRQALEIAYESGQDMIDRHELLHLTALSLSSWRHDFAPPVALAASYAFEHHADALHQNI